MSDREWVCKNCYAQNAADAKSCAVCGMPAPAVVVPMDGKRGTATKPSERENLTIETAAETGLTRSGTTQIVDAPGVTRKLSFARGSARIVGIALLIVALFQWVFQQSIWGALQGKPLTMLSLSDVSRFPALLFSALQRGFGKLFSTGNPRWLTLISNLRGFGATKLSTSLRHGPLALLETDYALCAALVLLWTLCLLAGCMYAAARGRRKGTVARMTLLAVVMNLLYLLLRSLGGYGRSLPREALMIFAMLFLAEGVGAILTALILGNADVFRNQRTLSPEGEERILATRYAGCVGRCYAAAALLLFLSAVASASIF